MIGSARLAGLTTLLGALLLQAGCTCGSGPYEGDYFEEDRPEALSKVKFKESEKGDPKVVGCADGQREAFADLSKFPKIAGCMATWTGDKSLRDKSSGAANACGDDGDKCGAPADACSPGWHVCGDKGRTRDLMDRVKVDECHNAGPGRFNAALSHGQTDELCPPKPTPRTVFPCTEGGIGSEPVCCGNDCLYGKCKDGVWTGKTKISRGTTEGCGKVSSDRNGGILCCMDDGGAVPAGPAAGEAKADDAKAGDAKADDAKAGDAKADDAKAGDAKADDAKKADAKKADAKKADAKKADAKKADDK